MTAGTRRGRLTDEDIEAAGRLLAIWERKKADLGLTQEAAGDAMGINQSAVSQYLKGKIPLGAEATIKWARLLRVLPAEIRPEVGRLLAQEAAPSLIQSRLSPVVWGSEEEIDPGTFVWAPILPEEINGGSRGSDNHEEAYEVPFRRSWLKQEGVKPEDFAILRVSGRSMEPVLWDGQVVGVNRGATKIVDGDIYAVRLDDHLMVKTLVRDLAQREVVLHSENDDKRIFPDIRLGDDTINRLTVVGSVFWVAGRPRGRR